MKKIEPHIKARAIFLVLVLVSMISTMHILLHIYHSELGYSDSMTLFQMAESVGIKEVGFVDFIAEVFQWVVVTLV